MANLLIYGSYGYTGRLIAQHALERGLAPILAGRNPTKLAAQATTLGLQHVALSLQDTPALEAVLANMDVVLHCAGPFAHTARPMVDACLRTGTHYLDLTGEIAVFEALAARDGEARSASVMLLPGVGFDVVPSDCLAAHLKRRLPTATRLTLAVRALGSSVSHGTAFTAVESLDQPSVVRRQGRLTPVPLGSLTKAVDFGRGPVQCVAIAWGDVSTAYYSTGIPNVEVYFRFPAAIMQLMAGARYARGLLGLGALQSLMKVGIRRLPPGPTPQQRAQGMSLVWGEVTDDSGRRRVSLLRTPESYALTILTAVAAAEKALAGQAKPGFQTPSMAFGADFVMGFPAVAREELANDEL